MGKSTVISVIPLLSIDYSQGSSSATEEKEGGVNEPY